MEPEVLDVEKVESSTTATSDISARVELSEIKSPEIPETPSMSEGEMKRARHLANENKKKSILIEEKQKRIDELEAAQSAKAIRDIPFPKEEDFETQDEFHKAHSDYTVAVIDKRTAESATSRAADESAQRHADTVKPFFDAVERLDHEQQERALKAEKELGNEDGTSKVDGQTQRFMIQNPDVGPQLMIHLHDHPDVLKVLNGMDEFTRPLKLNELKHNLIKAGVAKTKTGAPEPATTVDSISSGGPGSFGQMTPEEMNKLTPAQLKESMKKAGWI